MSGKPKHGLSGIHEYRVWLGIMARCTNPKHPAYPNYGGRGIDICDRWRWDVRAFLADVGTCPAGHEIDRIDNDRGYEPGNVRWVERKTNDRNRRSNVRLTYGGETLALAEWCERLGLSRSTVQKRLDGGWTVENALGTPVRAKNPNGAGRRDGRTT